MITTFNGKRISGVLAILPETEYIFDEETKAFATTQTRRLKKIMGFHKRRAAKAGTTTADLCEYGLQYLIDNGKISIDEIGAIVVVSATPDYFIPHMSNIIHGDFDFAQDVICMDIAQGCAAHVLGIIQSCMLLEHMEDKKVLLFTGDVLCRKDPAEPLGRPAFGGDAASITILENAQDSEKIYTDIYSDGKGRDALIMHAGGWRMPRTPETAVLRDIGDGTMASLNEIWMHGSKVFNFVQKEVPPMIEELLEYSGYSKEQIDWFLFHQPNRFMVQKLAERLKVPMEKMPCNIVETFGNSSGSCVPVNIAYNLGDKLLMNDYLCCLSGFGSGLTWAAAVMNLGHLDFCEYIISDL